MRGSDCKSKEAIAIHDEIRKEIRLGLQEAGRRLGTCIRKGKRLRAEFDKRSCIEKHIPTSASRSRRSST